MPDDLRYLHIAGLIFGQPLLATIEAAETVGSYIRARMTGLEIQASRFAGEQAFDPSGRWKGFRKIGSTAAISIMGELVNRGAWMGASSGLTSYEGIVEQVRQAAADPEIRAIVLDINSPGGEAWGMVDAARQLRSAAKGLPMVAVANSIAASAAYGLASAADQIVVNAGGMAGSIGVVMVHFDESDRLKSMGVKATLITTGAKKVAGHPAVPLSEDSLAVLQARAAKIMDGFVGLLTERRPQLSAEAIHALEGDVLIGEDAVAAGLADRVGTFESVLAELSGQAATPAPRGAQPKRKASMAENPGAPAAEHNTGITQAQLDAAVTRAMATGRAEAKAEADATLKAERTRIAGLDALLAKSGAGAATLIAAAKADGSSVADTAFKILDTGAHLPGVALAGLAGDERSARGATPAGAPGGATPTVAKTPEGWAAEYRGSTALQAEFMTEGSYVALKKLESREGLGRVA